MAMGADMAANLEKAVAGIRAAAQRGAEIVALPELFRSPYFCVQHECPVDYTDEIPGPVTDTLCSLSRTLGIVIVGGSIFERTSPSAARYNTALVFDTDGSIAGSYRKSHIPHDEAFFEKDYFAPGDTGFKVFKTAKGAISVLICFDQWFPEAARACALDGAEIIFYPTAIGNVDGLGQPEGNWHDAWETVQRGHAIANNVVVAAINRVGTEGTSHFWGGSFICDAFGTVLSRGGVGEEVIVSSIDKSHAPLVREGWGFIRNRRPELYTPLTKRI
jgi:agmatine deiminase